MTYHFPFYDEHKLMLSTQIKGQKIKISDAYYMVKHDLKNDTSSIFFYQNEEKLETAIVRELFIFYENWRDFGSSASWCVSDEEIRINDENSIFIIEEFTPDRSTWYHQFFESIFEDKAYPEGRTSQCEYIDDTSYCAIYS